ncbi:MAG: hypothetical protein QM770_15780 [Tepidisphaeraceae bacterium]
MANGYMPRADLAALAWMRNYAAQLLARPAAYFVTAGEAEALSDAVQAFADALEAARTPATRTAGAVAAKDDARRSADAACRVLYARIKADTRVDDADKVNAGVRPTTARRTRIGPPDTAPRLWLSAIHLDGHSIGCADSQREGHAKPFGATQVQLFRSTRGFDPDHAELVGCFTRTPIRVTCPPDLHGQTATYFARWMNRRGQTGPWSQVLSAPVVSVAPLLRSGIAA